MKHVLWIDDEISLLKPLILLLKEYNYEVTGVSNGEDGCTLLEQRTFDLILLDEIMPGKDGLATLKIIKEINPNIPVVMITKSEEEAMIDKAYTRGVQDFLVKPLKPQQLISTCKRILEREDLMRREFPQDFTEFYQEVTQKISQKLDWQDWGSTYLDLARWGPKIANESEIAGLYTELIQECEKEFAKFIETNYLHWLHESGGPVLSIDLFAHTVIPYIQENQRVYFIILDCLRFDQWITIRPFLEQYYKVKEDFYYSIIPSATPFARNAIYSGLYPIEIAQQHPRHWSPEENKYERELFDLQLKHFGVEGGYIKVKNLDEELNLRKNILQYKDKKVISIVVNFLDYLAHAKRGSFVLEELAPDEEGLRSLTKLWFSRSHLYEILKEISQAGNPIIFTTDHGSILTKRATIIYGGKVLSRNLRYKYGPALRCDKKHNLYIENPQDYKLPGDVRYGIAKEDFYFIYPTHPQKYAKEYRHTFQHGGISMQEMILPCITLLPKT